jgi:2-iminobutanoate/2-iminopropanoate deaminase
MLLRTLLAMVVVAGLAAQAQAAGGDRAYVVPDGYDPNTSPPYSSGLIVGDTFYVSGTLGIDPATGHPAAEPEAEARFVLEAVKNTLEKGGLTLDDLMSVTIYCTDISLYDKFNAVYRGYFHGHFPTRAFIGVSQLVRGAHFEIAAIAVKPPRPKTKAAVKP